MRPAPLLMPNLALQFPRWMPTYDFLALPADILRLLDHPRVRLCMLARPHCPEPNAFREVLCMRQYMSFCKLRQTSRGIYAASSRRWRYDPRSAVKVLISGGPTHSRRQTYGSTTGFGSAVGVHACQQRRNVLRGHATCRSSLGTPGMARPPEAGRGIAATSPAPSDAEGVHSCWT